MIKQFERFRRTCNLLWVSRGRYWRASMVHPPYEIRCNKLVNFVEAPDDPGALSCFFEVYIEDVYDLRLLQSHITPKIIVDIGANFGMFSAWARMNFPSATILSYEPNPDPFNWLEKNQERFDITTFQRAVADFSGKIRFDPGSHSTLGMISENGQIEVPTTRSSDIADGQSIDLLKLDCEGGEWKILRDPELLSRTKHLVMEFHIIEDYQGIKDLSSLIEAGGHSIRALRWTGECNGLLRSTRNR